LSICGVLEQFQCSGQNTLACHFIPRPSPATRTEIVV
jgi:hypothetical protein